MPGLGEFVGKLMSHYVFPHCRFLCVLGFMEHVACVHTCYGQSSDAWLVDVGLSIRICPSRVRRP